MTLAVIDECRIQFILARIVHLYNRQREPLPRLLSIPLLCTYPCADDVEIVIVDADDDELAAAERAAEAPAPPAAEPATPADALLDRSFPATWVSPTQDTWRLFIMFQHNIDMLKQAVRSFAYASKHMVPNLIIIDNSASRQAIDDIYLQSVAREIIVPPRRLNFPQLHNFVAELALERRLQWYFWAHADNVVLPLADGGDMAADIMECLHERMRAAPDWGAVLLAYDHLAVFRTQAMVQVPWDPYVFQYGASPPDPMLAHAAPAGSECDAYGRLKAAKYHVASCRAHLSFDMARVVDLLPSDSYQHRRRKLEAAREDKKIGRNAWREGSMTAAESKSREDMKATSRAYLIQKWGVVTCKVAQLTCRRPWPYCPACPQHIPHCLSKNASRHELQALHGAIQQAFAAEGTQPLTPAD